MESSSQAYTDRVIIEFSQTRHLPRVALRAVLKSVELMGFAKGIHLAELRDSAEPMKELAAERDICETFEKVFRQASDILGERWDKIPDKKRPQYTPEQRFLILELKRRARWSRKETAHCFRVSAGTIARWEQEVEAHPDRQTVGSLVKPNPPVRRYADVIRQLVHTMSEAGFGGNLQIALTLGRAGWQVSKEFVRRTRKKPAPEPSEVVSSTTQKRRVQAKYPNHIFMADSDRRARPFRDLQLQDRRRHRCLFQNASRRQGLLLRPHGRGHRRSLQ